VSRAIARVAIAAAAAFASGCHDKPQEATVPSEGAQLPVPAPEGLLAEGTIVAADATWQRVQRGVGGPAGILPSTLGGIVCAASGIDPGLAPEIDGASAAYVIVAGELAAPGWVVAMRLVDARRARALVDGDTSRFDVRQVGDFQALAPKPRGAGGAAHPPHVVAAISRGWGWFVVAKSDDDLERLAPYATRTMPARASGKEAIAVDVPGSALAGPLRARIASEWSDTKKTMLDSDRQMRAQHGGRPPDFGDPGAIVARLDGSIQQRLAILSDLAGAHIGIDAGDDDLRMTFTARPASPDGVASQAIAGAHSGDVSRLRAVTRDAGFAFLTRDGADTRAKDASDLEAAVDAALGPRLSAADSKRLHGAIDDWTAARGDAWTAALAWNGAERGLIVDAQAGDPARGARAVREAMDAVAQSAALREPLTTWLGATDVTFGVADVPGGGRASTATVARGAPNATAPKYVVAWKPGASDVQIAVSEAPLGLLSPSLPGRTLGDDPAMRALLDTLGDVAGALVLQPSRSPACAGAPGGVALGWGRRDSNGAAAMWGEAVASDVALRCFAKSAF